MRAAIAFILCAVPHIGAFAQNNCPNGMGALPAGVASPGPSPCMPMSMVSFLLCANQMRNGRIEISSESAHSTSEALQVSGSVSGGNLAIKAAVGGSYGTSNARSDIEKASQKFEPALAECSKVALGSANPEKQEPWTPANKGGPRVAGTLKFLGPMGPLEPGISYNQGDIYDSPTSTAAQCSQLCFNDDRCLAVTWIESQKRCWVKTYFTGNTGRSPDMTSARKLITNR